jgi:hypothetical protein
LEGGCSGGGGLAGKVYHGGGITRTGYRTRSVAIKLIFAANAAVVLSAIIAMIRDELTSANGQVVILLRIV